MQLTARIQTREVLLSIPNFREVMLAMGQEIHSELTRRLRFGLGAHGPLPAPKDGGRPYSRSGRLIGSIIVMERVARGQPEVGASGTPYTVVRAVGERPAHEVGNKVKKAAKRTKQLRVAAAIGFALQESVGGVVPEQFLRKKVASDGSRYKLGKLRIRTAETNAGLAGILSVPPKDKRSVNGKRGVYRVFEITDQYRRIAWDVAKATIKVELKVGNVEAA